jgi:hypothetical protein
MSGDPIRDYLRDRGCPDFVVAGGIEGLVAMWERTVGEVEAGYDATLDEYLNDMDARQIIEDVLSRFPEPQGALIDQIRDVDARIVDVTRPVSTCIWGGGAAPDWSERENWWYFRVPRAPGPRLATEVAQFAEHPRGT